MEQLHWQSQGGQLQMGNTGRDGSRFLLSKRVRATSSFSHMNLEQRELQMNIQNEQAQQ